MRILLVLMGLLLLQSCDKEAISETLIEENVVEITETVEETTVVEVEPLQIDEVASNNGGKAVEYMGVVYSSMPLENTTDDTYKEAIYLKNGDTTEKFIDINKYYVDSIFINDGYMYYTDTKDDDTLDDYVVKVSLETKEKEYLQLGQIEFLDTENNEIYYTFSIYDGNYHYYIYKMDTQGENIIELAMDKYRFIEKVEDAVYLEKDTEDKSIILASVKTDGTDLKTVLETKSGAYIDDPEVYKEFEGLYSYEEGQYIIDFGIYGDTIYMSIGAYEGSGHFYYGGIIKVGKDGEGFQPVLRDVENFEIVDNNMYYRPLYINIDEVSIHKLNLDTMETTYISDGASDIKAVDEVNLYMEYRKNTEKDIYIYDLKGYNIESGETTTLFEGSTATLKEDSVAIDYDSVEVAGEYVYFDLITQGYNGTIDNWRGHLCFKGHYRVKKDGSGLELLYVDRSYTCQE